MTSLLDDVRFGVRLLLKSPGYAAVAIVTLALGIGITTAIFSAVYAVVLQPFPFPEPNRVVAIGEDFATGRLSDVSPGNFNDWRTRATSYSELGARAFVSFNIAGGETPARLLGGAVTHTYFSVFRVAPLLGRTFTADEDRPGRDAVVVLSYRVWRRLFAEDRAVVGTTLLLDGTPHTVIGVMSPAFDRMASPEEVWVPAAFTAEQLSTHDGHSMSVVGRLAAGVSIEAAAAELAAIFNHVKAEVPGDTQVRQGIIVPYASQIVGDARQRLLVLFGAVTLVMLIACGNVAHLLLARGRLRGHEVAVRASLGASRGRLVRQFLTEALVLALIGGALGVALAYTAVPMFVAISPGDVPRLQETAINGWVLVFAFAATVVSAAVAGIVPALAAARPDLRHAIEVSGRTVARGHDLLRGTLVAAEVALAIVLLVGAGLLIRSAIYLQSVNGGFDGTGVLTARVSLPTIGYSDPGRVEQAFLGLVERLSQDGAVSAAALGSSVPMSPGSNTNGLVPEGKTFDPNDFVLGRLGLVSDGYFRVLRIPLVAGRVFTSSDRRETERVMILSETAARRLFPGQNALGRRVACCEPAPDGTPLLKLVVGIVGDVRTDGPQATARADFYLPLRQAPAAAWTWLQRTMTVVARGNGSDSATLMASLRVAVQSIEPAAPIHNVATMQQRLQTTLAPDRFNTALMALLGAIGLLLSAIGIYGVIACFVAQRYRELAIRVTLGARGGEVVMLVMQQGMRAVLAGVAIGVAVSVLAVRALSGSLYGVQPRDPMTFALAIAVLIVTAMLANLLPARRAVRIEPATALRAD